MSEEIKDLNIVRKNKEINKEVDLNFSPTSYQKGGKKKKGWLYWGISRAEARERIEDFFGREFIWHDVVFPKLNQLCQAWTEEARCEDGTLDTDENIKFIQNLSKRGETARSLIERQFSLVDEMTKLDPTEPEGMARIQEILIEITGIKDALAEKKSSDSDEPEEEEKAQPATK